LRAGNLLAEPRADAENKAEYARQRRLRKSRGRNSWPTASAGAWAIHIQAAGKDSGSRAVQFSLRTRCEEDLAVSSKTVSRRRIACGSRPCKVGRKRQVAIAEHRVPVFVEFSPPMELGEPPKQLHSFCRLAWEQSLLSRNWTKWSRCARRTHSIALPFSLYDRQT